MRTNELFEAEAAEWQSTGKLPKSHPKHAAALRLWLQSAGAKKDGVSPALEAYAKAIAEDIARVDGPRWFEQYLRLKMTCSLCPETYRVENMVICSIPGCDGMICPLHTNRELAPNGNPLCRVCGKGELVG